MSEEENVPQSQNAIGADGDLLKRNAVEPRNTEPTEEEIDLNLVGSFPASDPPSWTLGLSRG